jgi:HAD superfamily hydrolase (TIGR01549 family)
MDKFRIEQDLPAVRCHGGDGSLDEFQPKAKRSKERLIQQQLCAGACQFMLKNIIRGYAHNDLIGGKGGTGVLRLVCFDFGFTLWNEERAWNLWADWLGVSRLDFFSVLGSLIKSGEDHRRVFDFFRPGINLDRERQLQWEAGLTDAFRSDELYADVIPCLHKLRNHGYHLAVAGNQFADFSSTLSSMDLPLDFIGSSEAWGYSKPAPEFFARISRTAGLQPVEIIYVGDRLDNDVLPAHRAGMKTALLRQGPWGLIHSSLREAAIADVRINSLAELPDRMSALDADLMAKRD